MPLCSTW